MKSHPKNERPPSGLMPAGLHHEDRVLAIQRAMNRYMASKLPVPSIWIEEYNALVELSKSK